MNNLIEFDLPKNRAAHIIKVVGVGGGGGNAVKNMYSQGIQDVSFVICNTDSQALIRANAPVMILLGNIKGFYGITQKNESQPDSIQHVVDTHAKRIPLKKRLFDRLGKVFDDMMREEKLGD